MMATYNTIKQQPDLERCNLASVVLFYQYVASLFVIAFSLLLVVSGRQTWTPPCRCICSRLRFAFSRLACF